MKLRPVYGKKTEMTRLLALLFLASCWTMPPIYKPPTDAAPRPDAQPVVVDAAPAELDSSVDASPAPMDATHVVGAFALGVTTPTGVNCSPGGARIDAMQVQLLINAGGCVPTTLHIEFFGDITTTCDRPTVIQCIEPGTRIIGDMLPLGAYHLLVDGLRAGRVCWSGDASIGVQAGGVPAEQSLTLLDEPGTCGDMP